MITVVYCGKKRDSRFEEHLRQGSGLAGLEILYYSGMHLAKNYNEAISKAENDVILFLRNDVEIQGSDWGIRLLDSYKKSDHAIIGVVGSVVVPMSGIIWEKSEPLVGRIWYESFDQKNLNKFSEIFRGRIIDVVTVEDSFLSCHRGRLKTHFDVQFKKDSYHDTDFCVENYARGARIGVFFEAKVLKKVYDEQDQNWLANRKRFMAKHQSLPYRLKPKLILNKEKVPLTRRPKVTVLLTNKGRPTASMGCIKTIYEKTAYENFEVCVVDMGSKEQYVEQLRKFLADFPNAKLIEKEHEHKPTILNEIVQGELADDAELLVFCDPDMVLLNDAISRMVKIYLENEANVGTIGIRMHTKTHMIHHFGLQLFTQQTEEGFELGLAYAGYQSAYKYKNQVVKNILGSSKDFLMISKELFRTLGGFNTKFLCSLEDFEINIRAILAGKKNILAGNAVGYYLGKSAPQFLPEDFVSLVDFINENVDEITPYVDLVSMA